jgi:hypothetical protein
MARKPLPIEDEVFEEVEEVALEPNSEDADIVEPAEAPEATVEPTIINPDVVLTPVVEANGEEVRFGIITY